MKCSKKRKAGVQVKRYQNGGQWPPGGVDPIERIVNMRHAEEYGQLLDYLQRFDQGEISPMLEGATDGAGLLDMMANPMGAARAAMEQGRRPTKAEIEMAGRKAGPMADVLAMSYPSMMAYGIKEGMPAAGLIPHSAPFQPAQQSMRVARTIDQGADAVRPIRQLGYVDHTPASIAVPTDIYRQGQNAAIDYIEGRKALFKTPEMQKRNARRIADNLTMVYNDLKRDMQTGNIDPNVLDDFQRIESSMRGGKVDPTSVLVQQILAEHTTEVDLMQVNVGPMAPDTPTGVTRSQMAAVEAQADALYARQQSLIKQMDEIERQDPTAYIGNPQWQALDVQVSDIDGELFQLQDAYANVPNVSYAAEASYGPGQLAQDISMKGKYLQNPRTARVVGSHEFEHGMQEAPYSSQLPYLHGSSEFQGYFPEGLPSWDVLETEMGAALVRRKVRGPTGIDPFTKKPVYRNRQEELFDKHRHYYDQGSGRRRERTTFLAEAKQELVEAGVIPNLKAKVTKQDVLKFYDELYAPEKLRKFSDMPIMDDPQSLRFFELFDPHVADNAKYIAEFMNRLSAVAVGAGGAAAASGEYGKGGKYKIVKNKTWKKMRPVS